MPIFDKNEAVTDAEADYWVTDDHHEKRNTVADLEFPETYRGFIIRYSDVNQALNATPDDETKAAHPKWVGVAGRTWEELKPVLDYQIEQG